MQLYKVGVLTNSDITSVYSRQDLCKNDSDCIWCNNSGPPLMEVDTRSHTEIFSDKGDDKKGNIYWWLEDQSLCYTLQLFIL